MTSAERAKAVVTEFLAATTPETSSPDREWDMVQLIAAAITSAQNEAEQRAIDRCRQIISTAIAGENADAESMRRLLLAAFDPRWDRVASIINPKD